MNAEEFPALLRDLTIPGATVGPVLNDGGEPAGPGSGLEYGFTVTGQHGARTTWQVVVQKDGNLAGEGPPIGHPEAVPAAPDRLVLVDVEQSIAAWIGQSAAGPHVRGMVRYSDTIGRLGIKYGLRLDLYDGSRVFIQVLWILEPGEQYTRDNKFRMRESV
jgi:hypothetical protein